MSAFVGEPIATQSGITLAVKDNIDVAGWPTGAGAVVPVVACAATTAPVVQVLLDHGHALVGKTAMVELAFGGWGTNRAVGAPGNPWDPARVCGGSSSGSAAAVASDRACVALGTDTGGSVRIPAALCGVVGYKPRRDVLPIAGVVPLAPSLDTVGVFARDVAGIERTMACFAPIDRVQTPNRVSLWMPDDIDAATSAALTSARDWLIEAGVSVVSVASMPDYVALSQPILGFEAARHWGARVATHAATMDTVVAAKLRHAQTIDIGTYHDALATRDADRTRELARWDGDLLLMPTVPMVAPRFADVDEASAAIARFTRMGNWLDLAALSLPMGLSPARLPVAVQIIAHPGAEAALFAVARWLEARRGPLALPGVPGVTASIEGAPR